MLEFDEEDDVFDVLNWGLCWQVSARRVAHYQRAALDFRARKSFEIARRRRPVSQIPDIG